MAFVYAASGLKSAVSKFWMAVHPMQRPSKPIRGMVITDFDGTLRTSRGVFNEADLAALSRLGEDGYVRAIATGRSLYSLRKAVDGSPLPFDYVLFSSGAGVAREPGGEIVRKASLDEASTGLAVNVLLAAGLDFMIHPPIPDNHRFAYHATGADNPDFARRVELYADFCWPLERSVAAVGSATQLLAIVPAPHDGLLVEDLRRKLEGFSVIRTTSPLDGCSTWVEVFPAEVSKGKTSAWLAGELGIGPDRVLAVGNDYNDTDLLDWAGSAFVVANAPAELKQRYPIVAGNDHGGVAEAVNRWLDGGAD